ncbi:hypothetical protein MIND_01125800 [Mycena indigotica]|uniref:alpha-L-rhamnosidase n=1 Tax=Mycena indigotica TaxID=2126181 RepID=A0A8H6S603_9AGAR|nr:uncharacterized protein MIND_01125800 [Mycena indigotica]KAF7293481.1 hypothetical protein MIND_01125800 [Mycena indigotica]
MSNSPIFMLSLMAGLEMLSSVLKCSYSTLTRKSSLRSTLKIFLTRFPSVVLVLPESSHPPVVGVQTIKRTRGMPPLSSYPPGYIRNVGIGIRESFPTTMPSESYIEFELGRSLNNIANTGLDDWVVPESSPFGGNPTEDSRVSATAYLYRMLDIMAGIARTLGKTDDANLFASQAAGVKTAFNNAFWANDHYAGVGDNSYRQTHNLLALAFNVITSPSNAQAVADSVAADVNSRGGHLNTGALGTKHILPMLTAHGHSDVAAGLIKQTTYPSLGFWIQNGATTCWEHWAVEARSHDHFFLGTYDDRSYQSVLGIQTTSTAYKTVSVAPAFTAAIPSASGWVMTPYGKLSVSYNIKGQSLSMQIVVPVGVSTLTVSGDKVQVGSGSYSFVAQ